MSLSQSRALTRPSRTPLERGPREVLHILLKRRWVMALWLAFFLCIGLSAAFMITPLYRSTTRLIIERDDPVVLSLQEVAPMHSSADDYYQTQYKIIESRIIARQAMKAFTPDEKNRLMTGGIGELLGRLESTFALSSDRPAAEDGYRMVDNFIGRVSVKPIANSRLVDVSFDSGDPGLSARAANAVASAYMDYNRGVRLAAVNDAVKWLDNRITTERAKLEEWELKLKAHEEDLKGLKPSDPKWSDRYAEHQILARETENARRVYDLLFHRHMETALAKDIESGNVRVVDVAESTPDPWFPPKKTVIFLSLLFGLLSGTAAAFFSERVDDTIADPEQVDRELDLPLLGVLPRINQKAEAEFDHPEIIVHNRPQSPSGEACKRIRTSIDFSTAKGPPQVVLVTSPGQKEGKTLTSANIAAAMAQTGKKVLIVDCDLRKPRLHDLFGQDNDRGVSNILDGSLQGGNGLIKRPGLGELDVLPAGPVPPNPSELLGSKKMAALIRSLRKNYHVVILDTPPVNAVTDTQLLAGLADGVVMVLGANATRRGDAEEAAKAVSRAGGNLLGAVLNGFDPGPGRYYGTGRYRNPYGQMAY